MNITTRVSDLIVVECKRLFDYNGSRTFIFKNFLQLFPAFPSEEFAYYCVQTRYEYYPWPKSTTVQYRLGVWIIQQLVANYIQNKVYIHA